MAIIGLGTMGSFAAVELARRGLSVIGLDQFTPPHGRGSHSGSTRIYRVAYPEGSGYVPLTQLAGTLWDQAAEQMGSKLLHRTGVLYMGPPEDSFLREVADSASTHHLQVESSRQQKFTAAILLSKFRRTTPAFSMRRLVGSTWTRRSHQASPTPSPWASNASSINRSKDGTQTEQEVHVHLEKESITAGRLIMTAGAWTGALLRDLQLPLAVKRKVVAWFDPLAPELFTPDRVPVFAFPENFTYGFPYLPGAGVRLAEHLGGDYLPDADSPVSPPGPADLDPLAAIAAKYMPGLAGSLRPSAFPHHPFRGLPLHHDSR